MMPGAGSLQRIVGCVWEEIHVASFKARMTRHGLPDANTSAGIARVTTLPAPITDLSPMLTPGQMMAPPPTQTSERIEQISDLEMDGTPRKGE